MPKHNEQMQEIFRINPYIREVNQKVNDMPAAELNDYRLTDIEEPTDEMLSVIMKEMCEEAVRKSREANKRYFDELKKDNIEYLHKWENRIYKS